MQLTSILTALSLSIAATATPLVIERNDSSPTPAQSTQDQCGTTTTAKCCNQVLEEVVNLVPAEVGIDCTALNLLAIGPLTDQCSATQVVACCSDENPNQTGLLNIGQVCSPITA